MDEQQQQQQEVASEPEQLGAIVPDYDKFSGLIENPALWASLASMDRWAVLRIVTLLALAAVGFNAETAAKVTIAGIMVAYSVAASFFGGRSKDYATNTEVRADPPAQSRNARSNAGEA